MVPDMIPFNPWGKHVVGSYKYLERTSGRFFADHTIAPSLLLQTLRPRYQHGVSNQDFSARHFALYWFSDASFRLLVQYNERSLDGPPFIPSAYRKDRSVELNFRNLGGAKGIHEKHVV